MVLLGSLPKLFGTKVKQSLSVCWYTSLSDRWEFKDLEGEAAKSIPYQLQRLFLKLQVYDCGVEVDGSAVGSVTLWNSSQFVCCRQVTKELWRQQMLPKASAGIVVKVKSFHTMDLSQHYDGCACRITMWVTGCDIMYCKCDKTTLILPYCSSLFYIKCSHPSAGNYHGRVFWKPDF